MDDRWITDWPVSTRFPHYTRANAGEVLADPVSPLGWTFGWDGGIVSGYRAGLIRCGAYELADFDPEHPEHPEHPESVACFGGYLYKPLGHPDAGRRNPAATVEMLDTAFFGDHPDVPPYVAHPDDQKPHLLPAIECVVSAKDATTRIPDGSVVEVDGSAGTIRIISIGATP